jgi:hypothetical protein
MTSIFAITMWFLEGRSCDYAFLIQLSGRIGTVGRRSGKSEKGEKSGKGKIIADCAIIVLGIVRCQWSVVRCKKSMERGEKARKAGNELEDSWQEAAGSSAQLS